MKPSSSFLTLPASLAGVVLLVASATYAQSPPAENAAPSPSLPLYESLKKFDLSGEAAVRGVSLQRDRVQMTFTGTFYFESPIKGQIRGAVFIGNGQVHADPPNDDFEKANVRRMIGADAVDSTFKTAVLRFSDDTVETLGVTPTAALQLPSRAHELASGFSRLLLRETGVNVNARIVVSILNGESPGFFCAEFDGGSRGRFGLVLDYQARIPQAHFGLDGGEKGVFFAYDDSIYRSDVWMAFASREDEEKGIHESSDAYALANISRYNLDIDLRYGGTMKLEAQLSFTALADGVRAVPLVINEDLDTDFNHRRDKALRLTGARLANGEPVVAIQESWDGSVTLVLPKPVTKGQDFEPILDFKGEYLLGDKLQGIPFRPRGRTWYPRTVPTYPSAFDLMFHHDKGTLVDSIGSRVIQQRTADGSMVTEWKMDTPVRGATFVVGYYKARSETTKLSSGNNVDLEYYALRKYSDPTFHFVLSESGNCVRYFSTLYGPYPYSRLSAISLPYQPHRSLPTMLMLPFENNGDRNTFLLNGREVSHQWWGGLITWNSYRDQWLDEGLAEYSGLLYTSVRDSVGDEDYLIGLMHDELAFNPRTLAGLGPGRLVDVGPIIMGRRLSTRQTFGAWDALVRDKGALVVRMLDFLFSDLHTGDDSAFFDMLKDFVTRYSNKVASTDDFVAVANAHFADTPIAKQYKLKNLDWFFEQWVYGTSLPSYDLSYSITKQADGSAVLQGTITQRNAPDQWMMPLPLVAKFGKNKTITDIVVAAGPSSTTTLTFPQMPRSISLDPQRWVLSQRTTTNQLPGKN